MITKKLKIKLLSDLCSGSGDTYNTRVDTDIVYDDFGLPFIPAKRIKGCIRESLMELIDFDRCKKNSFKGLFGTTYEMIEENGQAPSDEEDHSAFDLTNARLEGYENMKTALLSQTWHPQDVLELYSYTRAQTAIDPKSGTADENTLRTTRVVGKNNCFESVVKFEKDEYLADFEMAVKNVVHMGVSRTRGLGLVHITLEDYEPSLKSDDFYPPIDFQDGKKYILSYSILLKSAVICKSPEGNCGKTQPYIEGSKVLGLIAGKMEQQDFLAFMKTDPVFSTAYISDGMNRARPVSASVRKEKNACFEDGKMQVFDFFDSRKENADNTVTDLENEVIPRQYSGLGTAFLTQDDQLLEVDTEISYHHQRPDDKSIGRATDSSGSFYHLESIRQDQVFAGFIKGTGNAMNAILKCLNNKKTTQCRLGFSKQVQFGEAEFSILNVSEETSNLFEKSVDSSSKAYIVRLNSPVILYDENGMYSTEKKCFMEYLENYIGGGDASNMTLENAVMTYETIGGFNVTQKCRKPIFRAIGRGSIFYISSSAPISCETHSFIGERTNEGFGEIEISEPCESIVRTISRGSGKYVPETKATTDIIQKLEKNRIRKACIYAARNEAKRKLKEIEESIETLKVVVNKLILMCKTKRDLVSLRNQVQKVKAKDKTKGKAMEEILNIDDASLKEQYKEDFYQVFLKTYLAEWKILIRQKTR